MNSKELHHVDWGIVRLVNGKDFRQVDWGIVVNNSMQEGLPLCFRQVTALGLELTSRPLGLPGEL